MSTDFDLAPAAPPDPSGTGSDAAAVPVQRVPAQQSGTTRAVPVEQPADAPAGSLSAFLVTGGPAVALIAGCYLLWAFGPWLLLGALLLAAVAAVAVIRAVAARGRRDRSKNRAASPSRAGPSGLRGLLGRTKNPGGTGAGGRERPVLRPGGSGSTTAAAVRAARRKSLLGGAPGAAAGGGAPRHGSRGAGAAAAGSGDRKST